MHISVLQTNLHKALSLTKGIANGKYSLPVLNNVLLMADNGRLKITATDLELTVSVWIGARVEQEGAFTIPAKNFYDLVNNLSPERVDLELNARTQELRLNCGGTKVDFKGITADEFPSIQGIENGVNITMTGEMLRDMIGEVADSVGKVDNRPVLTGIYTNFDGNTITMASADGYRLTVSKNVLDSEINTPLTAIIPVNALTTIAKMIGKGKKAIGFVTLKFDVAGNRVEFDLGDIQVISNLIEGTFPMYENIVPKTCDTRTIVYTDEFLRACKKAQVFAKDSSNTARLSILPSRDGGSGTLTVSAKSSEMGAIDSMIDASINGVAINSAYNVEYLIDACKVIGEDQLILETINFVEPLVVRGVTQGDKFYIVIMPMQVGK